MRHRPRTPSDYFRNSLDREDQDLLEPLFSAAVYDKAAAWPGLTVFASRDAIQFSAALSAPLWGLMGNGHFSLAGAPAPSPSIRTS
jgi:hypothetical protein